MSMDKVALRNGSSSSAIVHAATVMPNEGAKKGRKKKHPDQWGKMWRKGNGERKWRKTSS